MSDLSGDDDLKWPWRCESCERMNDMREESCVECDKPRGWTYDGPAETPTDNYPADEAHRMEMARRLK